MGRVVRRRTGVRWVMWGGAVVAVIGLCVGAGWLSEHYRELVWYRFSAVKRGVLYRSGQLTPSQLEAAIRRYHLRAVVNLTTIAEDPDAFQREQDVCRRMGVEFVHLPMVRDPKTSHLQIDRFVRLVTERLERPILVHCQRGVTRTGFVVMAYRVRVDGWGPDDAAAELHRWGQDHTAY